MGGLLPCLATGSWCMWDHSCDGIHVPRIIRNMKADDISSYVIYRWLECCLAMCTDSVCMWGHSCDGIPVPDMIYIYTCI